MFGTSGDGYIAEHSRRTKLDLVEKVSPSLSLRDALYLSDEKIDVSGRRILIVEDEPTISQTLRFNLERLGHRVWEAPDGRKAIELAFQKMPHLILMDIMLPHVDGFQACAVIHSQLNVPIILVTAKGSEEDKVVGFAAGAVDYITKPFVLAELLRRVELHLR